MSLWSTTGTQRLLRISNSQQTLKKEVYWVSNKPCEDSVAQRATCYDMIWYDRSDIPYIIR